MASIPSIPSIGLRWGLILGVASAAYSVVLDLTGQIGNQVLGYVGMLFTLGAVILAIRQFKRLNLGFVTLGQGFRTGFFTAVIGGTISSVLGAIYLLVDPGVKTRLFEATRLALEEQAANNPQITDEFIEMQMGIMENMMAPYISIPLGILGSAFLGAIIAVIVAAIMRKDGQPAESDIETIGH